MVSVRGLGANCFILYGVQYINKLQIREVPDDFFVDIVSSNNFLVSLLTEFFATVRGNDAVDARDPILMTKLEL